MAKSPDSSNSTPAGSSAVKRGLFTRKPKEAKAKKPSRLKQIGEVFTMTRRHDPMVPWLMLLAFLGVVAVCFLVGVGNQLARSVPGKFAAAVHGDNRRAVKRPLVVLGQLAGRVYGGVLQEQDCAGRNSGDNLVMEFALGIPAFHVINEVWGKTQP